MLPRGAAGRERSPVDDQAAMPGFLCAAAALQSRCKLVCLTAASGFPLCRVGQVDRTGERCTLFGGGGETVLLRSRYAVMKTRLAPAADESATRDQGLRPLLPAPQQKQRQAHVQALDGRRSKPALRRGRGIYSAPSRATLSVGATRCASAGSTCATLLKKNGFVEGSSVQRAM